VPETLPTADARVTVMGLGRFGGGLGVTRWLADRGCDVLVTDLASEADLAEPVAQLAPLIDAGAVTLRLGQHNVSDFTTPDLVVASPAVPKPWDNRFVRAARAAGVPITTEVRLGLEQLDPAGFGHHERAAAQRPHVVAVTGTAGKSTTAAMIRHALEALGLRAELAGNIGRSLLDPGLLAAADGDAALDALVLELSSAQLHWLDADVGFDGAKRWGPHTAVTTNFAPNHLDWHGDLDHYRRSKQRLMLGAESPARPSMSILGPDVADWAKLSGEHASLMTKEDNFDNDAGCVVVSEQLLDEPQLRSVPVVPPGRHNRLNALLAAVAARHAVRAVRASRSVAGETPHVAECLAAAGSFTGLPHRLAFAGEIGGVRLYNDSKCTTPEAAALAINAFDDEPPSADGPSGVARLHLIAGGYDKRAPLTPMVGPAARCASVTTIGATGPSLADAVNAAGGRATHAGDLAAAAEAVARRARPGDIVLLSPGCASWDQFPHFEARGEAFVQLTATALASTLGTSTAPDGGPPAAGST
jgi:UDP-N-acetylmuramoylalanine--D-glutamate ligase